MFEGWPWERVCDFVRSLGYTGWRSAPFTLAEQRRRRHAGPAAANSAAAAERRSEILGLHWLLVKPAGLYLTTPDPAVRKRTPDYFVTLVHLCADLGGKVLVIGSPKQRNLLPGVDRAGPGVRGGGLHAGPGPAGQPGA